MLCLIMDFCEGRGEMQQVTKSFMVFHVLSPLRAMVKYGSLSHADGHPPMGVNTVNIAITWNPYGGMTISHAAIFQENSNRPTEHTCCHLQIGHERIPFIRQVRGTWGEVCSLCSHHFRCISCIIAVIRQDFWKSRR